MESENQSPSVPGAGRDLLSGFLILMGHFLLANLLAGLFLEKAIGPGAERLFSVSDSVSLDVYEKNLLRIINGFVLFVTFGATGLVWAYSRKAGLKNSLGLHSVLPRQLALIPLIMLAGLPLAEWLHFSPSDFPFPQGWDSFRNNLIESENSARQMIKAMVNDLSPGAMVMNFFVIVLIPAVSEEFFFRGFLMKTLGRLTSPHSSVWISAAVFSAGHFQFLGFFSRLALGAAIGYIFLYSGSLWASVAAHFFHNMVQLVIVWLAINGVFGEFDPFSADPVDISILLALASLVITTGLIFIYNRYKPERSVG